MLKEQDPLIELILEWIIHPENVSSGISLSVTEVFEMVEKMIYEYHFDQNLRLVKYLPHPPKFFLPLSLTEALHEYNSKTLLLHRRFIPPTFKEVRHILNLATVLVHDYC